MKKENIFGAVLLAFVLLNGCKKIENDELSGEYELKGSVYIADTVMQNNEEKTLPRQIVQLKYQADSNNQTYISQTLSDTTGSFMFTNISVDSLYFISAQKEIGNIKFLARKALTSQDLASEQKLVLYPDFSNDNLLVIICKDRLTNGLLSNTKVCIFTSKLLADSNLCEGSSWNGNADIYGKVFRNSIPSGTYYINARDSVGTINIQQRDSVTVGAKGYFSKTLFLK